jgi:hypothetical protein
MTLHCATKLGVIDHLYRNRHHIGIALGMLSEMPVAMCGSQYNHPTKIIVSPVDKDCENHPLSLKINEINLYCTENSIQVGYTAFFECELSFSSSVNLYQYFSHRPIFHPPTFSS